MKARLALLALVVTVLASSCSSYQTCATYSKDTAPKPVVSEKKSV